jgi:hypothetical protein
VQSAFLRHSTQRLRALSQSFSNSSPEQWASLVQATQTPVLRSQRPNWRPGQSLSVAQGLTHCR